VFEERNPADFKIFIGNLSWEASKADVRKLCAVHGNVWDVRIAAHKDTGCGRGFCHVEFETIEQADKAAKAINGVEFFERCP
jgi:RNA recognition motif-containing protein